MFHIGNISENTCQAQKKASCLCSMKPFLPEKWNLSVFLFLCVKRIFFQVLFPDLYFSCCGIRSVYLCTRCFFISSDFVVIRLAFFHFLPFQRYFLFIFCNGCSYFRYFCRFLYGHSCCITTVIIVAVVIAVTIIAAIVIIVISRVAVFLYFLNIDFLVHQQFVRRSSYINRSCSGCQCPFVLCSVTVDIQCCLVAVPVGQRTFGNVNGHGSCLSRLDIFDFLIARQRIFGTLDAFRYLCFTKVYLCNFASGYISGIRYRVSGTVLPMPVRPAYLFR